jgi:hypothetical protein
MKKIVLSAMLILAFGLFAMPWRVDDFETGNFGDINNYDQDGDGSFWEVVPTAKSSGNYMARSVSAGKTPDNLLDYPSVYVEAYSFISLWVAAEGETAETYQIFIDLNGPCMPDESRVIWEETVTSTEWKQVEIDLSSHLFELSENPYLWDANVYIGIRHYNSADQSALLIDDVMVFSKPQYLYDEGYFLIPPPVVEPYSDINMKFYVWDMSAYDYENDWSFLGFDNINLHYIITDADGVHPEASVPLVLNTDPEYPETYVLTMEGKPMGTKMQYWVEAADNTQYGFVGRSEIFNVEWGEINFVEGFEDNANFDPATNLPYGWVTFQTGDDQGNTWDKKWWVSQRKSHSGTYSIISESQNNFGIWLTDDYLVSPRKRVNGTPTLKYFVNVEAGSVPNETLKERWSLLISTVEGDGTDIENFVEVARDSIIPTSENRNTWYEKLFYLGDYQDQYVRVMWKRSYTSTGEKLDRYLAIDDVSIAEMPLISVEDPGNAAIPGEGVVVNATASDYSGINNVTIYYTVSGSEEMSVVMNDNGDGTFTGIIPGQPLDATCKWYCVVTDNSAFFNTTRSKNYEVIWFEDGILEWGSAGTQYADWPDPINGGDRVAMDWNFGYKGYLYLNKIEVGWANQASSLKWRLVEFNGVPTDNVIGGLSGVENFSAGGEVITLDGRYNTPISGHVALVFETDSYNEIMLDEGGNKAHAWQWNPVTQWTTNIWGAFYIRMYVSQTPNGIENEFVSSTTELSQNYPNPFNPSTSISFYNRIAGDVSLTVFNTKGETVASLLNEKMTEGYRKVNFNAQNLNSGVYYYTLKTPEKTLTRKMVLVK